MESEALRELLQNVKEGKVDIDSAVGRLKDLPFEDIGFAKIDHHRTIRTGYPEVVYCAGKTETQTKEIVKRLIEKSDNVMATRADIKMFEAIREIASDAVYHEAARIVTVSRKPLEKSEKIIAVVSAGTSDIPVAEEAAVTAETMGNTVMRIYDVGVAGIHRLLARADDIRSANVVIAVAGMEGALASVVGGLVSHPVIAVPTSIGYGSNFWGLSALLTMLNSCSAGIGVVNIDNGFGAGYLASVINNN